MPVAPETTTAPPPPTTRAEHIRLIRGALRNHPQATGAILSSDPRNQQLQQQHNPNGGQHARLLPPIVQSTTCKSTISSLLLSTFTNTHHGGASSSSSQHHLPESSNNGGGSRTILGNDVGVPVSNSSSSRRKKVFRNPGLRGLGCTAQPEVSVPAAVIRSSADWDEKKKGVLLQQPNTTTTTTSSSSGNCGKKKKMKKKERGGECVVEVQDVWCGPGIGGFSGADDFVAASTRPVVVSGRGKIDVDKGHQIQREQRSAYSSSRQRERGSIDQFSDLDLDSSFEIPHFGSDIFEAPSYHQHLRSRYTDGLSEFIMFQNGIFSGARSLGLDRYRDLRLDIENMSYEELLALSDKIGYVNTGLKEDQMGRCIIKTKFSSKDKSLQHLAPEKADVKCSICQEEFETGDETGKLACGHAYHVQCIKQWLSHKNACPVCKVAASYR